MARLGLYGGTFDPIHLGHLHLITQVLKANLVDRIILFPAGAPQLRSAQPQATGQQRRQMCELAISDLAKDLADLVEVNPIEILRQGPSYTIDTVEAIKATYPMDQLFLIIGTDAFAKIDQWHRIDELRALTSFIVIARPGTPEISADHSITDIGALDIASTGIREGSSREYSPSVAHFIKEHHLYGS